MEPDLACRLSMTVSVCVNGWAALRIQLDRALREPRQVVPENRERFESSLIRTHRAPVDLDAAAAGHERPARVGGCWASRARFRWPGTRTTGGFLVPGQAYPQGKPCGSGLRAVPGVDR
jgi:hypothetical protein